MEKLSVRTYRGHVFGPSDLRDPATGKKLFGISELKAPDVPPFLFSGVECKAYIKEHDPWDKSHRIDAYGRDANRRPVDLFHSKEQRIIEGEFDE
ncbi:MAG: hypothetical protein IKO00_15530 [Oscillospiraceae bacterium]|nr:hypothetical protein [Oscillospiraceae bacterium]